MSPPAGSRPFAPQQDGHNDGASAAKKSAEEEFDKLFMENLEDARKEMDEEIVTIAAEAATKAFKESRRNQKIRYRQCLIAYAAAGLGMGLLAFAYGTYFGFFLAVEHYDKLLTERIRMLFYRKISV
ncbi:unnamed protein product [Urochloa humidicola]